MTASEAMREIASILGVDDLNDHARIVDLVREAVDRRAAVRPALETFSLCTMDSADGSGPKTYVRFPCRRREMWVDVTGKDGREVAAIVGM